MVQTHLQQCDLLRSRLATAICAAPAAWRYIFDWAESRGRGVADGRRQRDAGCTQGETGGETENSNDEY
jgi:hypothetical protein